jgi:flagellar biogenesis protein FliO
MPKPKWHLDSGLVPLHSAPQLAILLVMSLVGLLMWLAKRMMPRVEVRRAVRALQVYHDQVF